MAFLAENGKRKNNTVQKKASHATGVSESIISI
jgi:hypothetical protein